MLVQKRYNSPFVVEKSKLTRLLDVIKEKLAQQNWAYKESFTAHLAGIKTVSGNSITQILDLDNSERSRVERLVISCSATLGSDEEPLHAVQVDFDSHRPVNVTIKVKSDDSKLASEVMSVTEEQVERMLERGALYKLLSSREWLLTALLVIGMLSVSLSSVYVFDLQISQTMWLTQNDLSEMDKLLQQTSTLPGDRVADVLSRQLRNVIAEQRKSPFSAFSDWRIIVILLPLIIIIGAFLSLASCYPAGVFLWGDVEESHSRLVARRNFLWSVVIGALAIGLIANLAVFALGSFIASGKT